MWERFLELFDMPVGYLLLVGIVLTILCTILNFKRKKVNRGYNVVNCDSMKSIVYCCILFFQYLVIDFTISYSLGVRDETGATLDKHILLFLVLLFFGVFMYFWCHYKKIYFNDNEIIVQSFLRKSKTYNWKSIISVKKNKMNDLIVKTIDGNKFCIEFAFNNKKNFKKKLEEKNIVIVE